MSADKRSVATDALATLGTIIGPNEKRDAIHLAVEPVVAGERLKPGDHITIENGVAVWTEPGCGLGIVDPFLMKHVVRGERFWFIMYPRMVHSLRHVWTHPAFPDEVGTPAVAGQGKPGAVDKKDAEQELRSMIAGLDCPSYETVMKEIGSGTGLDDEYLHFIDHDAHGEIPSRFWDLVEIILGHKVSVRPTSFSCSC